MISEYKSPSWTKYYWKRYCAVWNHSWGKLRIRIFRHAITFWGRLYADRHKGGCFVQSNHEGSNLWTIWVQVGTEAVGALSRYFPVRLESFQLVGSQATQWEDRNSMETSHREASIIARNPTKLSWAEKRTYIPRAKFENLLLISDGYLSKANEYSCTLTFSLTYYTQALILSLSITSVYKIPPDDNGTLKELVRAMLSQQLILSSHCFPDDWWLTCIRLFYKASHHR